MRKLLFLISMFVASTSYADEWKFVIGQGNEHTFWLMSDSIIENNRVRDAWFSTVNIDRRLRYDLVLMNEQFNCKQKSSRTVTQVFYLKGRVLKNSQVNGPWQRVIPGSIGEFMLMAACDSDLALYTIDDKGSLSDFTKEVQDWMRRQNAEQEQIARMLSKE